MIKFNEKGGAISFDVRVVPRASKSEVMGEHGGALRVRVAAPPVEGAANEELVRTLSKFFGVSARSVEITGGQTAKLKRVRISGLKGSSLENLPSGF